MVTHRAIIDLSSVLWTCLLAGKDTEHGKVAKTEEGKEKLVNSAGFGYENTMHHLDKVMSDLRVTPMDMIFVPEGMNAKADRQFIFKDYKGKRDKLPEQYEEFNKLKEMVMTAFLNAGSQFVWQDGGVEADDVVGYLAKNLKGKRTIVSGDKDLAVMVNPDKGIHHWRAGLMDKNPFGEFDHRFIPVYIALVGDPADKIPGAKGFGEVSMMNLLGTFGEQGLEMMEQLIKKRELSRLEEDVAELKELRKVIDSAENVYISYELARLRIEKVNTVRRPLVWKVGMIRQRHVCEDERLRKHMGAIKLVSAEHYAEALPWIKKQIELSPYVALDVETSTPDASDEWIALQDKDEGSVVDVVGSELTSLQLTFGPNMQFTVYLPIDNVEEKGVTNLTVAQVRDVVDMIPREKRTYIHNAAFELPVCYNAWGADWADDPLYHGFLRNVRDTIIASSYVDENRSRGLKSLSKTLLGYEQASYDSVTTKTYERHAWNGKGRVLREYTADSELVADGQPDVQPGDGIPMITVQHKMNQLTAREVLSYGADDTICTAALANHFQVVMEIEDTWNVYEEVETYPAYLCALAFVQGTNFSLQDMREMEVSDEKQYDEAWETLRKYLIKLGFEGTVCPVYTDLTPAIVKEVYNIVTGLELKTQVRTISKLAKLIQIEVETQDDDIRYKGMLLSNLILADDLDSINSLVKSHFKGEPKLDLASPKQMKGLLYDYLKIPVRVINDVTPLERANNRLLDEAVKIFKQVRAGKSGVSLTDEQKQLLRQKAKTDDTAIDMAVAFDTDILDDEARKALKALGQMKKVMTRRSLFYKNWRNAIHWKTGRIHSSHNQCAAVTRRYSASAPNDQQLPKKGEGVKFRRCYKPHKKNAVVNSIDYVGQELRLAAEVSQDKNMLACYVGDKLKDIHSITAAGALKLKWGAQEVNMHFETLGSDLARDVEGTYDLFLRMRDLGKEHPIGKKADDLRKDSKNVNFGAQNGARAAKLSETLIMPFADAQLFLDARSAMFPDVDKAAEAAAQEAKKDGYVKTLMGARRHLREAILSDERGVADRAARQAWNFKIQSSAAEMVKMGMTRMWLRGIYFKYDARFIAPIHDELVSSVAKEHALDFIREKHDCMAQPYATMKVPVLGSISIGPDFAQQHECGDWFIESKLKAALDKIFKPEEVAA